MRQFFYFACWFMALMAGCNMAAELPGDDRSSLDLRSTAGDVAALDGGADMTNACTPLVGSDPYSCGNRPSEPPGAGYGVWGHSDTHAGVIGTTGNLGVGVEGIAGNGGAGVAGYALGPQGVGVEAESQEGTAVRGEAGGKGLDVSNSVSGFSVELATRDHAAVFHGPIQLMGSMTGLAMSSRIDHPLAPSEKYLHHWSVESAEMKTLYDGLVELDTAGEATVVLPAWFEALNRDVRYQLTTVGGHADVYIDQEIHDNHFRIAGGRPGLKVSWQVTGVRHDAWAATHRIPNEIDKPAAERGRFSSEPTAANPQSHPSRRQPLWHPR